MSLDDPVIITCSISGVIANRDQCPAIPYTPEDYAAEARRLLRETDESIIQIALDLGYSSPSHFAQVFRRQVGVSPRDYRG